MITFKTFPNSILSEIGQFVPYQFAFMSAENKQCHSWVQCRDFLNDALRGAWQGKKSEYIYGFTYNPETMPKIDVTKMRMLVSNITEKQAQAAIKILNLFEKHASLPPSIFDITQVINTRCFIGPKAWVISPFLVSLYTYLIRLGYRKLEFETKEEFIWELKNINSFSSNDNDVHYTKASLPVLFKILDSRKIHSFKTNKNYNEVSIHPFHNHSGIVNFAKGTFYPESLAIKIKKEVLNA